MTRIVLAVAIVAASREAVRWAPPAIASGQYESTPTFTPDGREVYFMRSDTRFEGYRILASRCAAGGWTTPLPPSFAAAAPALDADPFVTPDGARLYFVSTRDAPGRAQGRDDFDVWVVDRTSAGTWGAPVRLPEPVNSTASELLPRTDAAGRLYFGSARAGGQGKGDIYRATFDGARWTVENVGAPVSTDAFEYEADVSRDGRTLVVVADRGDRSHLYRYTLEGDRWVEKERIPAFGHVFQVGPLLSPKADRLLFAQADGARSGEMFVIDLVDGADRTWPPGCDSQMGHGR